MKRLILFSPLFLICMAVVFYLSSGNAPQINRSGLLFWRITLYAVISGAGWCLYDHFPSYRSAIRRIALWFIVLIMLNEIAPKAFR